LQKSAASWLAGQKTIICVNGGGGLVVYIYSKATGNHPSRPHPRPPTRTKGKIKWGRRKKRGKNSDRRNKLREVNASRRHLADSDGATATYAGATCCCSYCCYRCTPPSLFPSLSATGFHFCPAVLFHFTFPFAFVAFTTPTPMIFPFSQHFPSVLPYFPRSFISFISCCVVLHFVIEYFK